MQKNAHINVFSNIYRNHDIWIEIRLIKFRINFPTHSSISRSASLSESKIASRAGSHSSPWNSLIWSEIWSSTQHHPQTYLYARNDEAD